MCWTLEILPFPGFPLISLSLRLHPCPIQGLLWSCITSLEQDGSLLGVLPPSTAAHAAQDLRWKYTHDPSFQGCPLALLWGLNPSHSPEGPHDWLPQHLTPPALPKLQGHWTTLHLLPKSDLVPPWCLWDGLFPIPGVPAPFSLSSQPPRFPWGSPPETELHASSPLCPSQRLYLISDCGGSLLASEHRALKASRGSSALGICLPCRTKSVLFPGGQPTEHSVCAPAEHLPLSWLLFPRGSLPGYSFSSC